MFVRSPSTAWGTIPKHSTSPWIRLTKRPLWNYPGKAYSSTATLGNEPDLQQRHWKNLVSKMSIISLDPTLDYFKLIRFVCKILSKRSFSFLMKIVNCSTSPSSVTRPCCFRKETLSTRTRSTHDILDSGVLL